MKILREPLVQFLLIGAALFGVFGIIGKWSSSAAAPEPIVIPQGLINNLVISFQRSAQRSPNADELNALIEDYVREEILFREARKNHQYEDDPIVRRQIRKRMEFDEDSAGSAEPSDAELRDFMVKHPQPFLKNGTLPELADVHDAAQREWQADRHRAVIDAAYERMKKNYTEVREPAPSRAAAPTTTAAAPATAPSR